jgi:hypothetical protein
LQKAENELSKLTPEDAVGGHEHAGGITKPLGHREETADWLNRAKNLWGEFARGGCWQYYANDKRPGSLAKKTDNLQSRLISKLEEVLEALEKAVREGKITQQQALDAITRIKPKLTRFGPTAQRLLSRSADKLAEKLVRRVLKKVGGAVVRKIPGVGWGFFAYDWYTGGFQHAVNEALWPISELWD